MTAAPPAPLSEVYDLAIIGGGINGCGIAADAAGRGLSVFLCEQHDLAAHTSSASTKLIHGGLRYLEQHEFRLVREALSEREVLMRSAPHLIRPLRFILPHQKGQRPLWLIRAGLFLYDHLGEHQSLPPSQQLQFSADSPLLPHLQHGFAYSDCQVDDARLVIANAVRAREHGAHIHPQTRCLHARRQHGYWHLQLERRDGTRLALRARTLVNAAGPWAGQVGLQVLQLPQSPKVRLIQGSHLVVPRFHSAQQAWLLQNEDGRVIFVLPWLDQYSLIGTTDRPFDGDPARVCCERAEEDYLLRAVARYFRHPPAASDIVARYSGVRALHDLGTGEPASLSRDYRLQLDCVGNLPLLSVLGGKLTTYRRLAEAALTRLAPWLGQMAMPWTAASPLPGGENFNGIAALASELCHQLPWLDPQVARRWAGSHGSRAWLLLDGVQSAEDLGEHFAEGLYAREVDYLCRYEWATDADDILWRRTHLGLGFPPAACQRLQAYLQARHVRPQQPPGHESRCAQPQTGAAGVLH